MINVVDKINAIVARNDFFQLSLHSLSNNVLVIAGSDDFSYYHSLEIYFSDIFTIVANVDWRVDTSRPCIEIIDDDIAIDFNKKYLIEKGHSIFKLYSEDNIAFFIVAKQISFKEIVVKY